MRLLPLCYFLGLVLPDVINSHTWTYFFALPYKLCDPGTVWSDFAGTDVLNGGEYNTKKLTFSKSFGDSSEDWYILYSDKTTNLLAFVAYIVTANKSVEAAEK